MILIILLAGGFRWVGLNWDQGNHLHPDERFLTMVSQAMSRPKSLRQYFNPQTSSLNPQTVGYDFFVYGTFPLTINKLLASGLKTDNYDGLTLQGRSLAALFDCLTLILVYATAKLLTKQYHLYQHLPLWSAFAYGVMVLPIQLAHFFATDTLLTTLMTASLYFSLRLALKERWYQAVLAGLCLGLALATKINAVLLVPLDLGLIWLVPGFKAKKVKRWGQLIGASVMYLLSGYFGWRLADPTVFASTNWLNPMISQHFIDNVKALKIWEGPEVWFPPAVQWINKAPVGFALKNMTLLGVGLVPMILGLIGISLTIKMIRKNQGRWVWLLLLGWVGAIFLYQSTQFVKALRYFIYLYPLWAIWAGLGASWLATRAKWVTPVLTGLMLIWPLMFVSIYLQPHARVQASVWILDNIPANSLLLSEYWDDGLPINVPGKAAKVYRGEQLKVFDPDTPEKWQQMEAWLAVGDYYLLTSNRGWGSIPTVPEKYPRMSRFYEDLLAGRLPYQKVAEFTAYPSLKYLGIPISLPDDWADETFTVYDHPKVMIYKLK